MTDVNQLDLKIAGDRQCRTANSEGQKASDKALAPLHTALGDQDFAVMVRMVSALRMPPPFFGLVGALSYASKCLSSLCDGESFVRLRQFRDAAARIAFKLSRHTELPSHLTATPDPKSLNATLRLFFERSGRYPRHIEDQICAIKALALTHAVGSNNSIAETFAARLLTLQRSAAKEGKSSLHWQQLAANLPFRDEEAQALLKQTTFDPIRDFVQELLLLLDGKVPDLMLETDKTKVINANHCSAESHDNDQDNPDRETTPTSDEDGEESVRHSDHELSQGFVDWQKKRATNAHRLAACGFPFGWNHLHPLELQRATTQIATVLETPSSETRNLACLAAISLASGLPPALALCIPLLANDDLWLDIDAGILHWNLNRVTKRQLPAPGLLAASYHPSSVVRMPLPILVASSLKSFMSARGDATRVDDLLFPVATDKEDLLSRYEQFLKLGDTSSHCPRPARFAYSLGRCVLASTGQDVIAALCSLDFTLAASGQLHYVCLNESLLFDALDSTYEFLRLGKIIRPQTLGYIGSPYRPRDEQVITGWRKILGEVKRLEAHITPRMAISDFIGIFNQLNLHNLGAVAFLSGHRGTRLERLTYPMLFSSNEFLGISDKESSEYSSYRVLPRFDSLDCILDAHLKLLKSLATRMNREDRMLAKRLEAISTGQRKHCPLFFTLVANENTWKLRPIRTKELTDYFTKEFAAARNFGRHFWLSKLIERGASRMLVRFLLGHARRGMEPHGAAGGVSVRTACDTIAPTLDSIASECGFPTTRLAPRATIVIPRRVSFSFPRAFPESKNESVDDYIASLDVPGHRASVLAEPCPFDSLTLVCHTAIEFIRGRFIEETSTLTPWSRLLLALLIFDGIFDSRQLESTWAAIPGSVLRLGQTPIIEFAYERGFRPILLQPPSASCLDQILGLHPIEFETACHEVSSWAQTVSGYSFSTPKEGITFLAGLMRRWMSIEISPWLITASTYEFSSACISMPSIARLSFGRPASFDLDDPYPPARTRRNASNSLESEIDALAKIVRRIGDTTKRTGENRKRLIQLKGALEAHLKSDLSPMAADICIWQLAESTMDNAMEVASDASYLGRLKPGLKNLDPQMCFADLDPEDWLALQERIEDGHNGEQLKQQRSALRRLANYCRNQGCAIPGSIFAAGEDKASPIKHASAVYISERDVERVGAAIADYFQPTPLLRAMAEAKLALCASAPLRSGEISRVRTIDIGIVTTAVAITSSGFSHLKKQGLSRGNVELGEAQYLQLVSLRDQVAKLSNHRDGYLWLVDDPKKRFWDVSEIDQMLGRALRLATGEKNARIHSFRGSAIARKVTPHVGALLECLVSRQVIKLPSPTTEDSEWLRVSAAARQARHTRPLTTIRYYCGTWPLQMYLELFRTLERIPINDGYARLSDGTRPAALRQAVSRIRRKFPDAPLAEWQMFTERLKRITSIPSIETLLSSSETTSKVTPHPSNSSAKTDSQRIHYLLLRQSELEIAVATDESRIPTSYVPLLEKSCLHHAHASNNAGFSAKQRRDWQRRLASPTGQNLISAAAHIHDVQAITKAIRLLDQDTTTEISEECLLQVIRTLRDVVPKDVTFNILPSMHNSSQLLQQKIRVIDPDATIKRSSKRFGCGYVLTLSAANQSKRGPLPDGMTTEIFRQALRVQLTLLVTQPFGDPGYV